MRLNKSLLVGVAAIALIGISPASALQPLQRPTNLSLVMTVQATVADAEAALNEAISKLETAKAEGADTTELQAAVEAAKANLAAAQEAEAGAAKAAEDAAAAKAAEDAAAAKAAEDAKAAEEAAAAKAAEDAAAAKAAEDAAAAKAAEEAAAAKAAEDAKAAEEAAAAKAAEDAAAAKAAEEAAAKAAADAEAAKAAGDAEATKAAEEAAAAKAAADAKAAEEAAAAKAATDAEASKAAGDAEATKAAEEAATKAAADAEAAEAAEAAAAAKAAEDAAAATKAAEEAAAKAAADAEAAKAAGDAEAAKAAEEAAAKAAADAEAAKAAEAAAAAKAAEDAAAAKAAQEAAPAPAEPAATAPAPETAPVLEVLPEAKMEEAAPMLDSAKEELPPPPPPAEGQPAAPAPAPIDPALAAAPAPADDNIAREALQSVVIQAITQEQGERINEFPPAPPPPPQQEVVKIIDNRTIFTINNITYVEAPEDERLVRKEDEVIIERLPRQRTRETIVRDNGIQVVTVKNRWGDVIQRSRILPDGREVILAYTPEYDREEYVEWRDPVYDLPPLTLRIDVRDYTLDARTVDEGDDDEVYYRFLEQPPVERVERVYSVLDVKRSARVRDKARRIEMGNITFGFGTADIEEDQIDKLQGMADAMLKLIKKNPAETFLIEGHTDAVGSDNANLALSDKRAESVAIALSNVFDVPSENLTTQGYGERYLKVKTEAKEPLNRRVVFRRITPLVTPVASAQ